MAARLAETDTEIFIDGEAYTTVLQHIHDTFNPLSYLEVGTFSGDTLRLSHCPTIAVDPAFYLAEDFPLDPPRITLHTLTSDAYFAEFSPAQAFGRPVDFAFLDGMHEFPFLLRDFINTEKACTERSIIAMHDCVPRDAHMTRLFHDFENKQPSNYPDFWTGDVWKMGPVLRKYRPDLDIRCLDAAPTGLLVCTKLDPANRVLEDRYDEIVQEWEGVTLEAFGMRRLFEVARIEPAAAWRQTLRPLHRRSSARNSGVPAWRRQISRVAQALGLSRRA